MAAIASGIFSQATTAAQAFANKGATPMSTPTTDPMDTSSTSSTDSTTISANDFLTLLVTEMQNQDPTATTDPNEYINQLVNVNSLEQLISINQNLSTALGTSTSASGAASTAQNPAASTAKTSTAAPMAVGPLAAHPATSSPAAGGNLAALTSALKHTPGNLTVPDANPAAQSVASALSGKSHDRSIAGEPR
jgi:flagellar basal-body rod modification protein FlgD